MRNVTLWSVLVMAGCAGGGQTSSADQSLTGDQCQYFANAGQVTICHSTGSKTHPFQIIKTSVDACEGHDGHAGDYVAVGDPTCSGLGCYPEGAPYDGTAPCCDGLQPAGGVCKAVPKSCAITLGAPADYNVGSSPWQIAIGDIDRDGNPDVAVGIANEQHVAILRGDAAGGLAIAGTYPAAPQGGPYGVALGDFNGDGRLDLAAAGIGGVFVMLGNGDGTFGATTNAMSSNAFTLAIADVDGDGLNDIVTAGSESSLWFLHGNGDGTFGAAVEYTVGLYPQALALGDLDGDGDLDAATANLGGGVSILINQGAGVFGSAATVLSASSFRSITIADLDNDGHRDIAAAEHSGAIDVLLGHGNGTFANAATYDASLGFGYGYGVTAGDLNGDGVADLVVANLLTVVVLPGRGDGTFGAGTWFNTGGMPGSVALADFNHDGKLDVMTGSVNTTPVALLPNTTNCQ